MRNYLRIVIAFVAALLLAYALRDLEDQPWVDLEADADARGDFYRQNYDYQGEHEV